MLRTHMNILTNESAGLKHYSDSKAFIKYSNDMNDTYENTEECNPNKEHKILILFDDTIVAMLSNKKFQQLVT